MSYLDLMDPSTYENGFPIEYFKTLRESDPLHWHHSNYEGRGYWIVTRAKHFDYIKKNPEMFSSEEKTVTLSDPVGEDLKTQRLFLVNIDSPKHQRYRKIVGRAFTLKHLDELNKSINVYAKKLIENVAAKGGCDFIGEVASKVPLFSISELMGIRPEDREFIEQNAITMTLSDGKKTQEEIVDIKLAAARLLAYGAKLYQSNRENPRASLTGMLVSDENDSLSLDDYCFFFLGIMLAGFETTRSVIGS